MTMCLDKVEEEEEDINSDASSWKTKSAVTQHQITDKAFKPSLRTGVEHDKLLNSSAVFDSSAAHVTDSMTLPLPSESLTGHDLSMFKPIPAPRSPRNRKLPPVNPVVRKLPALPVASVAQTIDITDGGGSNKEVTQSKDSMSKKSLDSWDVLSVNTKQTTQHDSDKCGDILDVRKSHMLREVRTGEITIDKLKVKSPTILEDETNNEFLDETIGNLLPDDDNVLPIDDKVLPNDEKGLPNDVKVLPDDDTTTFEHATENKPLIETVEPELTEPFVTLQSIDKLACRDNLNNDDVKTITDTKITSHLDVEQLIVANTSEGRAERPVSSQSHSEPNERVTEASKALKPTILPQDKEFGKTYTITNQEDICPDSPQREQNKVMHSAEPHQAETDMKVTPSDIDPVTRQEEPASKEAQKRSMLNNYDALKSSEECVLVRSHKVRSPRKGRRSQSVQRTTDTMPTRALQVSLTIHSTYAYQRRHTCISTVKKGRQP